MTYAPTLAQRKAVKKLALHFERLAIAFHDVADGLSAPADLEAIVTETSKIIDQVRDSFA